jgi:hypothetical protein
MIPIYTGNPAPLDGKRRLTPKEALQRAKAMACARNGKSTECQGQLHIGLFFDGTGNNLGWVEKGYSQNQRVRNKHSNVARLWDSYVDDPVNGFFRVYIPGVGTPFKEIGDTTAWMTDNAGSGFAFMGADRICWGITSLLNAVHRYLTTEPLMSAEQQKGLGARMACAMLTGFLTESALRWSMLTVIEEKLRGIVKSHPRKVLQINVSIFGFSRGAAEARACAHWMHQIFERESGGFELAAIPIRIGFMGIFDTVAAVGVGDVTPVTFGHMAWAAGTQSIHPAVEDCAHFIALHEQRASFPLESATGRGNVGYPGMHSDVGGGYCPGEQGKAMPGWGGSPQLSQIPLIDMHFAALKAGVPLLTIEQLHAVPALARSFAVGEKVVTAYNRWVATNGISPGPVREFMISHTNQYLRWRGSFHGGAQSSLASTRFFKNATSADLTDLAEADRHLGAMLRSWRERKAANETLRGRITERAKDAVVALTLHSKMFTDGGKDPLSAHEERFLAVMTKGNLPPDASIALFEDYVHDSRAGFRILSNHEPAWLTGGYARYRNVFSQEVVDGEPFQWANESLKAVRAASGATVEFFQKLYGSSVATYDAARSRIHRNALHVHVEAASAGRVLEESTKQAVTEVNQKSEKIIQNARNRADEAARFYAAAQRAILLRYIAAEEELQKQQRERWGPD